MAFDVLSLFLLPAVAFLGIITSYEDIKKGRIHNKWIVAALAYSFILLCLMVAGLQLLGKPFNGEYVLQYFANVMLSLAVGLGIWLGKLWSAGDAKLFTAYAALVPLSFYQIGYVSQFPAFILLVNTFVPLLLYYLAVIAVKSSAREKIKVVREILRPGFLGERLLFLFVFFSIGHGLVSVLPFPFLKNGVVVFLFVFVMASLFGRMAGTFYRLGMVLAAILIAVVGSAYIFTISFAIVFLITAGMVVLLRNGVLQLAYGVFSHPVYLEDLKPGMIAAENFVQSGKRGIVFRKIRIGPLSPPPAARSEDMEHLMFGSPLEGITAEEIRKANKSHKERFLRDHTVRVYHTVPFAPFLFAGAVLTILVKGNVLVAIKHLL